MNNWLDDTLARVAERMFASMASMIPLPKELAWRTKIASPVSVSVGFDGPLSGTLVLTVPAEMLPALARNLLELDDDPTLEKQLDALKELGHVICGNLLPLLAGPMAVFRVHAPKLLDEGSAPGAVGAPAFTARTRIVLDEGEAELTLYANDPLIELAAPELADAPAGAA